MHTVTMRALRRFAARAAGATGAAAALGEADRSTPPAQPRRPGANPRPGEPSYTRAQVAANDGSDGRPMWVSRGGRAV